MSEKPSQKHKFRAQASISLSISPFTTCFQSLQTVWIQKIADTLGIFIYLKRGFSIHVWTCSMFRSKLKWIFLQDIISCYLVTYHMWQRLRRACANVHSQYSIQHAAWYTSQPAHNVGPLSARQRNAIQMAVRWRAGGGPLLDVYLDKVGSRLQESPVVCFHTSTHRPKSITLHVRQCRKERVRLPI